MQGRRWSEYFETRVGIIVTWRDFDPSTPLIFPSLIFSQRVVFCRQLSIACFALPFK